MFEFFHADDWLFLYRDGTLVYAGRSSNFGEANILNMLEIDWTDRYIEGVDVERYNAEFDDWREPPKTSVEMSEWLDAGWTEGL